MTGKGGYFRVPLAAAQAITGDAQDATLLAAYMTLWRFAYGPGSQRDRTAAGAQAIRKSLGVTDYQSKRLLRDLLSLRYGSAGESGLVVPAVDWNAAQGTSFPERKANAQTYILPGWQGEHAFLPSLLMDQYVEGISPISRLCKTDAEPLYQRDALLVLLSLYAAVDYGRLLGADPQDFAYREWAYDGIVETASNAFELGYLGQHASLHFWLVREDDERSFGSHGVADRIFGSSREGSTWDRFWPAFRLLEDAGLLCRVSIVSDGRDTYPLWVFSPSYRQALEAHGINGGLAADIHRVAAARYLDPDKQLIAEAVNEDLGSDGTGLFICATQSNKQPLVRTIYTPRLYAPTAINLDGLQDMANRTSRWEQRLKAGMKMRVAA